MSTLVENSGGERKHPNPSNRLRSGWQRQNPNEVTTSNRAIVIATGNSAYSSSCTTNGGNSDKTERDTWRPIGASIVAISVAW